MSSKRLSTPAKNDLNKLGDAVSSFIALTNRLEQTKCESLTDTLQQLETNAKSAVTSQEECKDTDIDKGISDDNCSSDDEQEEN
jgi:phage shock protein A